jgi:tRNA pseudouridine55 synthase
MDRSSRRSGILLVSKPQGLTSHDVVERIRHSALARGEKVGHAGTLDPFATGLLLVLIGRATRAQRYFMKLSKTYRAEARFGVSSNTGDPTGTLTETDARVDLRAIEQALPPLRGEIRQQVPLTSAVKVAGERLYRKARRGELVETPVRLVRVGRLELLSFDELQQLAELEIDCSAGTYIRQLVADLGELCGTAAYCTRLERLAIGPFELEDADDQRLIPLSEALVFLPERALHPEEAQRVQHGGAIEPGDDGGFSPDEPIRLTLDGELVAIAERRNGMLKPVTVLRR